MKHGYLGALAVAGALALIGCDSGASAVAARDHSQSAVVETAPVDVKADPAPLVDGKPIWTSNSRHTAQENAEYHFDRDGSAFGAKSPEDFSRKAYAFIEHPPKTAQTLTRANGDRLIYDPASNTFAVATRDGQPRTLFKPDDGPAYWAKQKDRLNQAQRSPKGASGEG
jgi:pyocin large subunit-like protein